MSKRRKKDYCESCGLCESKGHDYEIRLYLCKQCRMTVCNECRSKKLRCPRCASYDLPSNCKIVPPHENAGNPCGLFRGDVGLDDIPKPHRFYYDDPKHIPLVKVYVQQFVSIGKHLWVDLKADSDPIWDPREKRWCEVRDHPVAWSERKPCDTMKQAKAFIRRNLKEQYGKNPVVVQFEQGAVMRWFYREGD